MAAGAAAPRRSIDQAPVAHCRRRLRRKLAAATARAGGPQGATRSAAWDLGRRGAPWPWQSARCARTCSYGWSHETTGALDCGAPRAIYQMMVADGSFSCCLLDCGLYGDVVAIMLNIASSPGLRPAPARSKGKCCQDGRVSVRRDSSLQLASRPSRFHPSMSTS